MKSKSTIAKLFIVVALQAMLQFQVFALEAQQIESIVTVDSQNQLVCPQHPQLTQFLVKGSQTSAGDLQVRLTGPGGTQVTYHIPKDQIKAAEIVLTQADQQQSADTDGDGKTDAQNVLGEISENVHLAPNYGDAANILQPFVPYINILLGLITTVVVLSMQILTALDLCYIAIPTMRNFMSTKAAEGNAVVGKKDGNGGVKLRFISDEAQYAVDQAANNQGRQPWGIYFKSRILSYIFLAVAMVILLTGNITLITDLIVKLVSGLMSVVQGLT